MQRLGVGLGLVTLVAGGPVSCETSSFEPIPTFADGGWTKTATPMGRAELLAFEGMYDFTSGEKLFGADAAVRTSRGVLTITSGKDSRYAVLAASCLADGSPLFEGYWHGPREGKSGLVRLTASPIAGVCAPSGGTAGAGGAGGAGGTEGIEIAKVELEGAYSTGSDSPKTTLRLTRKKELKPFRGRFFVTGHHGACENTDHCGASSNSLEGIRLTDQVGGNAIEIDIRTTKDGVPVLFHDPSLGSGLVRGTFCKGAVADLTLEELRANCVLENGEVLPTLDEALDVTLRDTELEAVYLDMKVPEAVAPSAPLVKKYREAAARLGRPFAPVIALTKESVTDAYLGLPKDLQVPCLVEYDPDLVLELGCVAWGPTWTSGPQVENVEKVREGGALTVYWTLNHEDFIKQFLEEAKPNGFITARLALGFYMYQKYGTPPPLDPSQNGAER